MATNRKASVIHALADRLTPSMRRQFLAAVKQLRGRITVDLLAEAILRGGVDIRLETALSKWSEDMRPAVATINRAFQMAREQAEARIVRQLQAGPFTVVNERAVAAAQTHGASMVTAVGAETKRAITSVIARAIREGNNTSVQARSIRQLIGLTERQAMAAKNYYQTLIEDGRAPLEAIRLMDRYAAKLLNQRALTIARTETIRASSAGRELAWKEAQQEGYVPENAQKRWVVTDDDRLCDACQELDDTIVALDDDFAGGVSEPPLHPNCLPADAFITPCTRVAASSQRRYDGNLIVIRTARGEQLACTPNHPVLTDAGWLPARLLNVGGYVVGRRFRDAPLYAGRQHDEDVPASIEQIAKSFGRAQKVTAVPVPVSAEDFHGDGRSSKVAVIRANRLLLDRRDAALAKQISEYALVSGDVKFAALNGLRVLDLPVERDSAADGCQMCRRRLRAARDVRHLRPLHAFGLGLAANLDAGFPQAATHRLARTAEGISEGVLGFTGGIARRDRGDRQRELSGRPNLDSTSTQQTEESVVRDAALARDLLSGTAGPVLRDQIIDINVRHFAGHVFNLETEAGAYLAGETITHNCRCTTVLVWPNRGLEIA